MTKEIAADVDLSGFRTENALSFFVVRLAYLHFLLGLYLRGVQS